MKIEQIDRQWSSVSSDCLIVVTTEHPWLSLGYKTRLYRATKGVLAFVGQQDGYITSRDDSIRSGLAIALEVARQNKRLER